MSPSGVSYEVVADVVETETRGEIYATSGGEQVGELHFADYDGVCQITRIRVDEDRQREGIATGMVAELRAFFPASVPAQFLMNADARQFHGAVIERFKDPTV